MARRYRKELKKLIFLAFQRCGNASFRPERPYQLKNPRFEGWDYPNRPRRIEWKQKIRGSFVWYGASIEISGFL